MQAAKDLLERVGRAKSGRAGVHLDQIVDGMRRFSLACIQLANLPVDKKGEGGKERERKLGGGRWRGTKGRERDRGRDGERQTEREIY